MRSVLGLVGSGGVAALAALAAGALAQDVLVPFAPLVPYQVVGNGIPKPLTDQPGDPVRGKTVVTDATNATCLICHTMPDVPEQPDQGNLAPPMEHPGSKYTAAELRLRLVNPKLLNPDTIMPAYYRLDGLTRVQQQYVGKTVYKPQDIEDVIAYLLTLK